MHLNMNHSFVLPKGICKQHYWIKRDHIVEQIHFNNRTLFSKYERINSMLTDDLILDHFQHKITLAHSLIFPDKHIENIIIDYNGDHAQQFYHHLKHQFSEQKIGNFTAYQSKTPNHLHVYLNLTSIPLQEGIQLGKIITKKLSDKILGQCRIYPNNNLPEAYNILNLPYDHL